ncbi:MAG: hypothetical protein HUU10_04315 [Bacteroidetes bacterium]|nr:hypothetical protein [Bacteroidota bacterium]
MFFLLKFACRLLDLGCPVAFISQMGIHLADGQIISRVAIRNLSIDDSEAINRVAANLAPFE